MTMRVAFLMGNRLNPWHTRMYEPLLAMEVDLEAFTYRPHRYPLEQVRIPFRIVPNRAEQRDLKSRLFEGLMNRLLGKAIDEDPTDLVNHLEGFDLIHSWELFSYDTHAALDAKKRWGTPVLVTVWDNIPHHYERDPVLRERKRRARREADRFLVYTHLSRKMLLEEGVEPTRIRLIPPAVNEREFHPGKPSPPRPPLVLGVGRMVPEKGFVDILEAVDVLRRNPGMEEIRVRLLGSGPEGRHLDRLAQKMGFGHGYERIDSLPYSELPDFLRQGSVLVLASRETPDWAEQFGMVLVEAMACGIPVIGAKSGAIPEMIGNAGWLYEPGNLEDLVDGLKELLGNPVFWKHCRQRGLERCRDRFSAAKNARKIFDLYGSIVE